MFSLLNKELFNAIDFHLFRNIPNAVFTLASLTAKSTTGNS